MTHNYIPYSAVADHVPSNSDEQVNINHVGCPAGTDNKRRLYVKRKINGEVVWYCHHCDGRGSWKPDGSTRRSSVHLPAYNVAHGYAYQAAEQQSTKTTAQFSRQTEVSPQKFSTKATAWLRRYGITDSEVIDYGIGYVPDYATISNSRRDRVVLPCYSSTGLAVLQHRKLDTDYDSRKYVTNGNGVFDSKYRCRRIVETYDPWTVVLVEDILSAIKVGRQFRSIALLTVHADYDKLLESIAHATKIVVWLDNDNIAVRKAARMLQRKLGLLGKQVSVVTSNADPKHHTDAEILEIISSV